MKARRLFLILFVLFAGCDEPETVVTNIVHEDGSLTRLIEMRNVKNNFNIQGLQVPFDSSWKITDSVEISGSGDTTWIKRASRTFASVDELNMTYRLDSFDNNKAARSASFSRKFRWFNTEYSFSERIEKYLDFGYPVNDFMKDEELMYFYSPESFRSEKSKGPDSLRYSALEASVEEKTEEWLIRSIISGWTEKFGELASHKAGNDLTKDLKNREDEIVNLIKKYEDDFDSLWKEGFILREILGTEKAALLEAEADSALNEATEEFLITFHDYSARIIMPGRLTGTNGFVDSSQVLLWPVKSDFFLTQPYEMWAKSKKTNVWAWIVSGLFVMFVAAGIVYRKIKKG